MALGERLNLEFQHVCYCNVASHYGYSSSDSSPAGVRGVPLAEGLGSIALTPFFSVGSPQDGSTFPAPSLKLLTLRSATLPGYEAGQIQIKRSDGQSVSAATCGLSVLGRAHGNYLPSCIPLRRGGEGKFLETNGDNVVNTAGTMLDLNSADLYTAIVSGTPEHPLGTGMPTTSGSKIKGIKENVLGPSPCISTCGIIKTPACGSRLNTTAGAKGLCENSELCLMEGNELEVGPWPWTRWHAPNLLPFGPRPSRILGKGWTDRAQDNPKIYGQSEIYWNWSKLGRAQIRATATSENPSFCKQYRAGTLTVGLGQGSELNETWSWRDNFVRPLAGAPIRFQTIPFLYESSERAYNSKTPTTAAEKPYLPLYKNGYFHSLVSDPVFYRYRAGPLKYKNDPPFVYDDSCKDSQQQWLPHHKGNIVLKAVDPGFNWIDTVPKEPIRASSQDLICVGAYLGPWCASYNKKRNPGEPQGYHQYWAKNAEGTLSPTCYITSTCEVDDYDPGFHEKCSAMEHNSKTGYPKGSTVTYKGCCWESRGDTFISYNNKGKQYQTLEGPIHMPPGTSFLADGETPKWIIKSDICDRAEAGLLCDIGKITFGEGLTVQSSQSPGTAYKGAWAKGTTYNAGEIVNACDEKGINCGYYKSRRDKNSYHKPVITTSWKKPVNPYQTLTALSDKDGEVESRYEKALIDNWWELSPEPLQTDIIVSKDECEASNTIAVKAGYDPCDPCISGFDASEAYGPDQDVQVVRYDGKVWKATGYYYAGYDKPGEYTPGTDLIWVEYRPKFCWVDEINFGSGLYLDYCTTPATCNWPTDDCEEGGSQTDGNCGPCCREGDAGMSPRLNVKTVGFSGVDCSGSGVPCHTPSCVEFTSGDFIVERTVDEFGCETTKVCLNGWTVSGATGSPECTGVGQQRYGHRVGGVREIRLGTGLHFEDYATDTGCCSETGGYVTIGAHATLSVSGRDCDGSPKKGHVTGVNYNTGDFCVELLDECEATIRTKGWTVSGVSGAPDCTGIGSSRAGTIIEGVKHIRLGTGLHFEESSAGECCSGNYVTIGASSSVHIDGRDCSGGPQFGDVTDINYHSGDFCVGIDYGTCDGYIRTKGWTVKGFSGVDCSDGGTGDSPPWDGATPYNIGDRVGYEGLCYQASVANTANTPLNNKALWGSIPCGGVRVSPPLNEYQGVKEIMFGNGLTVVGTSGVCCSGNTVTVSASTPTISGVDCSGSAFGGAVDSTLYHTGDFCVSVDTGCDATIRTKGWTFSGHTGAYCSGHRYIPGVSVGGVKEVRLGSGLYFEDYSTGICCSGNYVTIGAYATLGVSGIDCSGSGQFGYVTGVNYHTGDFCVEIGYECDATIRTKGWTFSGTSGAADCSGSGDTAGVKIEGVKDIRLGSGLYFEDYSTGICCSGNYVTIGASATLSVSGADCSGSGQVGNVTGVNYHTGDFCVEIGDECDATIRTKGWTVKGFSGLDCSTETYSDWDSATQYEGGERVKDEGVCYLCTVRNKNDQPKNHSAPTAEASVIYWQIIPCEGAQVTPPLVEYQGVKEITFGPGLTVGGTSGVCCSGNTVTVSASTPTISGVDCSGSGFGGAVDSTLYHTGDFCVSVDTGCDATIRTKGWTFSGTSGVADCSGSGDTAGVKIEGVKDIRLGSGLYFEDYSTGICCSGNYVTIGASATLSVSGADCSGSPQVGNVTGVNYHTGDFCVEIGDECDATIRTKGWTVKGFSGLDCSTETYSDWDSATQYEGGERVKDEGVCYLCTVRNKNDQPKNHSAPTAEASVIYWQIIPCEGAQVTPPLVEYQGVKEITFGPGLTVGGTSGVCCSGNTVTVSASTPTISGVDCSGSGFGGAVDSTLYHTGDFCVSVDTGCDATIRTKGWTFSGTSGVADCSGSGDTAGVKIEGVKDIRLGSGLYFEDYSTGICCSGNYVTIGASATLSVSGADCSGSPQVGNVTGVNYHTGDFCVEIGDECDATIRTKGWTVKGFSGLDCSTETYSDWDSATQYEGGERVKDEGVCYLCTVRNKNDQPKNHSAPTAEASVIYWHIIPCEGAQVTPPLVEYQGVKEITFGQGLTVGGTSGVCCSGNTVTVSASTPTISGVDCSGSGFGGAVDSTLYHTGDFCVSVDTGCDATIRTKGWTFSGTSGVADCSGSGDTAGVSIEGVKDIRLGSGLYFEDYSTGICCSGNYVTIGASATLSVSGADCSGSPQVGNVTGVNYHTGDFCVEIGDECDATIRTKGWTVKGFSGLDCSTETYSDWDSATQYEGGERVKDEGVCYLCTVRNKNDQPKNHSAPTAEASVIYWHIIPCEGAQVTPPLVEYQGVKEITFGQGLTVGGTSGVCCSGNTVTVSASTPTISGVDCSGSGFGGAVDSTLYHTGDFCVSVDTGCDATIRTKGWTFSGTSGVADCSGSGDTAGVKIEGVKDIRLGSGLYFEDYSTGICCSGNYVTIGASATLSVSGADCNGLGQVGNVTGVNYHTGDFCVEIGDECDATIRTKGITVGGYTQSSCETGSTLEEWEATPTYYDYGDRVSQDGSCWSLLGIDPNEAYTSTFFNSSRWSKIPCEGATVTPPIASYQGIKHISFGEGLKVSAANSGQCCSGNAVTISASTPTISGVDCAGSGFGGAVDSTLYHTGDFCVSVDTGCDATIRTKGWTFSGTSGFLDCSGSGATSSATIEGVKDIRLGTGLYFEDYSTGICCSGNYVTIGAITSMGISGIDCEGEAVDCHTPRCIEFNPADFVINKVEKESGCSSTQICSAGGFTLSGHTGKCHSGDSADAGKLFNFVRDLRLGSGLYIEDHTQATGTGDSTCCTTSGYVTIGANILGITVSGNTGELCSGRAPAIYESVRNFRLGNGLYIEESKSHAGEDDCNPTGYVTLASDPFSGFRISGITGGTSCSGGVQQEGVEVFRVKDIRFGSGLYIENYGYTGTGECDADNHITLGATAYLKAAGYDCSGNHSSTTVTGINYHTGDFCVEGGDECDATIRTKGWTFSGTSGTTDCSGSGDTAGVKIEGVKDIRLGSGLYFEDYSDGICCSGNHVTIGAASATFSVSGADCSGSAQLGNVTGVNYNTADFCVEIGDECDATIRTKGWTFSGTSGVADCSGSGDTAGVKIEGVKDIRLGSGLYFEDYSDGICCSGNYVTIGAASATFSVSGADCNGSAQLGNVTGVNYHTGDFCVELGDECDATVRTKGWTFRGTSGTTDCSGNGDTAGVSIEGVKDIRLGSGLYFEDYSDGICCSGNYVTIGRVAPTFTIEGVDCSGSTQAVKATGVNYYTGDFWVSEDCSPVIRNKGINIVETGGVSHANVREIRLGGTLSISESGTLGDGCGGYITVSGASGGGCPQSVKEYWAGGEYWSPSGCEGVLQVSGCSGISTSINSSGVLSICYTGATGGAGTGCANSVKEYWAGGEYWSPSDCEGVLQVSGCSGISTSINSSGVLSICYTGATGGAGTGCANSVKEYWAGGEYWSPSDCEGVLQVSGCSGISTSINSSGVLSICYTGATGGAGTGCANSVKEYWAGGEYWSPSDCEGVLQVSGCSGISTSINSSGVLSICYTGATGGAGTGCANSVKEYWAGGEYWSPSDCEGVLQVSGCSGISTSINSSGVLSICYTGATGGAGTGCANSVKEYWAGGEYWSPSDCEGVLQVSGCSGISTSINSSGVLSICYTGATGGAGTGCANSVKEYWAGGEYWSPSDCEGVLQVSGCSGISTSINSSGVLSICYTGATGGAGTGCANSVKEYWAGGEYWSPSDCEGVLQVSGCSGISTSINSSGVLSICYTGATGGAGTGCANSVKEYWAGGEYWSPSDCEGVLQVSGCSGISTSINSSGVLSICYTGATGGAGTGCANSVKEYWAGGEYWSPSDCEGVLQVSGCSGISTSINSSGVLSICYTGATGGAGTGCANSVKEYWAGGEYWSPSDCEGVLQVSGCSGISTSINSSGVLSICYTGATGGAGTGCANSLSSVTAGGTTWNISGCDGALSVSGSGSTSVSIDSNGNLIIGSTAGSGSGGGGGGGCASGWGPVIANKDGMYPTECNTALQIYGCSGITTAIREGTGGSPYLEICQENFCSGLEPVKEYWAGGEYWTPTGCEGVLYVSGCSGISTDISSEGVLSICYTGATGGGCTGSFTDLNAYSYVPNCQYPNSEQSIGRSYSAEGCNDQLDYVGYNGVVITGGSGHRGGPYDNPSLYFSTTAFSYIYDDDNNWAVGKSYPESSDYNRFKIKGCSGIHTRLTNTGCSDEVHLEICYTGATGGGGGGAICPDGIEGVPVHSVYDSYIVLTTSGFSDFNPDCWVSGDRVCIHGVNSDAENIYVPSTVQYHVGTSLNLLGDFSNVGIKNYTPVGDVNAYHGPCAMSENALEKTITLCIGGTDHSGNILFNPS